MDATIGHMLLDYARLALVNGKQSSAAKDWYKYQFDKKNHGVNMASSALGKVTR